MNNKSNKFSAEVRGGVFVLFVHFLAVCTRKHFQINELKIRQVAKAYEAVQPCYKRLLTPLPPENARSRVRTRRYRRILP